MAQTTTTAGGNKTNVITGFVIAKLDHEVLHEFAEENSLDLEDGASDEQVGVAVHGHLQGLIETENLVLDTDFAKCDRCEGIVPLSFEKCPFCGLTFGQPYDAKKDDKPAKASKKAAAAAAPSEEEVEGGDENDDETAVDASKLEEVLDVPPPEAKTTKSSKKTTKKGSKTTMTTQQVTNGKSHGKPSTALVKASAAAATKVHKAELVRETDLDVALREFEALKVTAMEAYYAFCLKVVEISEKKLWKLRLDADGKQKYTAFDTFAAQELGMEAQNAYFMIGVVRNYTEKDIEAMGPRKLALILRAPPEDRDDLAAAVQKGMPKSKLEKAVKDAKAKRGYKGAGKRGAAGAKAAATTNAKKAEKAAKTGSRDTISIATIEGATTIKLFKQPATMKGFDPKALKDRAKTLDGKPFGVEDLPNGVRCFYSLQKTDGGLALRIERKRLAAE